MKKRPKYWFDNEISLPELRRYLNYGKKIIRIASGFFTLKGYGLINQSLKNKKVKLLVGIKEPASDRARKKLVKEIMKDLRKGVNDESYNRYEAVLDLVERIQGKRFDIVDARAKDHHAKIYIIDERYAVYGSFNVSQRGLKEAVEFGSWTSKREIVREIVKDFERHFNDPACRNLTQELLEELLAWLNMASPWDIYLKTLEAIRDLIEIPQPRPDYKMPVGYQRDVVSVALRQIEEYNGSMIVASTGLGKTIIGTEIARQLHAQGAINKIIVIGPRPVKSNWKRSIQSAGLGQPSYYTFHACNTDKPKRDNSVHELLYDLENLSDKDLIIIDESHVLRNRYTEINIPPYEKEQLAFKRLIKPINDSGCRVLLLTGTPFSVDESDINDQLCLLPHKAHSKYLPGLGSLMEEERTFQIIETKDLKTSPVSLVITTPYVAKYYSEQDEEGDYLYFGKEKRYLPAVYLRQVKAPLPIETDILMAIDEGYFTNYNPHPKYTSVIKTQARVAWQSSPWALQEIIQKTIATPDIPYISKVTPEERKKELLKMFPDNEGYWLSFEHDQRTRHGFLSPIFTQLDNFAFKDDKKFMILCSILERVYQEQRQAIIFTEQLPTAGYLEAGLNKHCPFLRIANTVRLKRPDSKQFYKKMPKTVDTIMDNFARIAHGHEPLPYDKLMYHILIATDAYGVGVNLQDASVVINYDMAWTPINPAQRAGRILRMWHKPRNIYLYSFKPTLQDKAMSRAFAEEEIAAEATENATRTGHANSMSRAPRWDTLISRHDKAVNLIDLPTVATEKTHDLTDLKPLASAEIENLGKFDFTQNLDQETSPIFEHFANLEKNNNAEHLKTLPDDLRSAMVYSGRDRLVFVLLRVGDKVHWPVYNLTEKKLKRPYRDIELLKEIACTPDTQPAAHKPQLIEKYADTCIKAWCAKQDVEPSDVERICTLYLKPSTHDDELDRLLK